ncbi:hypothetical protein M9Y10_013037 [Tritrichomonas musculus]|uniref:DUF4201 domain-containing protein n=1 Tax=Tritrichomonas musculus TaxID=1915356 RepID=A0ABR2I639_9EUKA
MLQGIIGNNSGNGLGNDQGIDSSFKGEELSSEEKPRVNIINDLLKVANSNDLKAENVTNNDTDEIDNACLNNISTSLTKVLLNQVEPNQKDLENNKSSLESNSIIIAENDNNKNADVEVEEEEEENEEEEKKEKEENENDEKNSQPISNTTNHQNDLNQNNDIKNSNPTELCNMQENDQDSNVLQNLSNSLAQNLLTNNKKEYSEIEYEEEEEEEEEYEEEEEEEESKSKKHIPPRHLLEAHPIESKSQSKKSQNDPIEDLENEVMITGVSTPKTDFDDTNSKKNKKAKINKQDSHNDDADYTEEELEKQLNRFLKTKKPPPKSACPKIADYAREKTLQLMLHEEYDKAYQIQVATQQLMVNIKDDKLVVTEKQMTENIEGRISDANQQQKDINYKYQDKIEEFEKLKSQSRDKLIIKHQNELDNFFSEWDNEKTLFPFLKQSPKLLQLRHMQKAHAMTMDFVQAKQLKKAADKLQKDETQIAKLNASNAMKSKYNALLKQQQTEFELWEQNWERKRQTLEKEKQQEEEANENLRTQLHNKLMSKKIPKRQSVILPINSSSTSKSMQIMRTQVKSMMIEYRNKTAAARLDLRPAEIKAIVKPKLPSPRKLTSSFS